MWDGWFINGKEVTLLDGDGKRIPLSCPGSETVEEKLYLYFLQRSFPEAVHAEHCNMGDGGRLMWKLVQNMCVTMDVVVCTGKEIEIQPPVVTFTSEDAFARDCMDDEERDERDARREERRRMKKKIQRKFERKRERESERASKKPKTVVD